MSSMPQQKPGKSVQEVQTPPEFIKAVKELLGIEEFAIDLAAHPFNTQASGWFDAEKDALKQPWHEYIEVGWGWLNPPYAKIQPWVQKAGQESALGAKIAVLVPAAVGSKWWYNSVYGIAQVYYLNPRVTFVGHKSPYPKDLALLLYRKNVQGGSTWWRWKP